MGRASSNKKVARAARAAGRGKPARNLVWPMALAVVVALGSALIFISLPQKAEASPPILGDHWHAAYGMYVCDKFLPAFDSTKQDTSGIHSHGDNLIHIEPFSTRFTGSGANIGAFADGVGLTIGDDRVKVAGGEEFKNGDDCKGKPGVVQVKVWDSPLDQQGRFLKGDFADYAPKNGSLVTIAIAPQGVEIPKPPSASAPEIVGASPAPQAPVPPTSAGATATTTTPPPSPDATAPSTTVPSTGTSTTAPAP